MVHPAKNTICLWYDGDAEDAARFYATTFPDSSVGAVHRAPGDFPFGKQGEGFVRISYAAPVEQIGAGIERMGRYLRGAAR